MLYSSALQAYEIQQDPLTNTSNPCGACMTELGCSSSSDLGLSASTAALAVSSFKAGSANFGGSGVGS